MNKNKLNSTNSLKLNNETLKVSKPRNDPNYPPLKKSEKQLKNKINKSLKKTKKNNEKIQNMNKIEWGLGVEHEFVAVIDIKMDIDKLINILQKINEEKVDKIKNSLQKLIKKDGNKIYLVVPYTNTFGLNYVNIEASGINFLPMYEVKNMSFYNVTLKNVLEELGEQQSTVLSKLSHVISDKTGLKLRATETPFGAHKLLFNKCGGNNYFSFQHDDGFKCLGVKNIKTYSDYTGSYHFWITLPHKVLDNINNINMLHQKAIFLLQAVEPLFCAIYGSCDPNLKNKTKKLLKGSFRTANNMFANYGIATSYDYTSPLIYNRFLYKENITSHKINLKSYLNQVENTLTDKLNISKIPNYQQFVGNEFWGIGADFRRKNGVKGFEFRIWDHFPQKYLEDILKIVYLVATHSYDIKPDNLQFCFDSQSWNDAMSQALLEGYKAKINQEYLDFISNQLNIKLKYQENSVKLLEQIINNLYQKVLKNKKHHYWTLTGESNTSKNNKKPIVVNINKMSQDFANQ